MTESSHVQETQSPSGIWYREMTKYHWIVFIICSFAWAFDCMDQHLFTYARAAAVGELMLIDQTSDQALGYATLATSIMMIGWATGGIIFGIVGDKFGRARTMFFTILIYSILTGMSAFSYTIWDFMILRFLAGIGIGGQFAIGASLLAESMPGRARPYVLGIMQVISGFGNIGAALVAMMFTELENIKMLPLPAWRSLFLFGTLPVILAYFVAKYLKEPETWKISVSEGREKLGSIRELFTEPTIRKHVILGMILAATGVIGAWGIGLFSMELSSKVFVKIAMDQPEYKQLAQNILDRHGIDAMSEAARAPAIQTEIYTATRDLTKTVSGRWRAINLLIYNFGAMAGMYGFTLGAVYWGRRMTFTIFMIGSIVFTSATFLFLNSALTMWLLVPPMAFFLMSMFGGYTIYFPELFPTRLRSTGISFCYNVGRYIAACGPLALSGLTALFAGFATEQDATLPFRYAGVAMCSVFIIGIIVIWFLPETKGKPLPD
jgi:MFS family permease